MNESFRGVDAFWAYRAAFRRNWETFWPHVDGMTGEQLGALTTRTQHQVRLEQRQEELDDRH